MSEYTPKVSIVIPAYNAANYLAEAIDSALAQTYSNIEIIVVNDGSKDNGETARVAAEYGDKIRYFEKENGGSSSALNYGIRNMTGEWFSWLSHDDLYYPQKIEREIEELNGVKEDICKNIFFSADDLINETGAIIRKANIKKANKKKKKIDNLKGNEYLVAEPTKYNFHGCSCLIHKQVFEEIGLFDENLTLINDSDMWYRLYANGYILNYVPEALVKGRIHKKQISRKIGFSYNNAEQDWFWNKLFSWLKENHPKDYQLYYLFGKNAFLKNRAKDGKIAFEYAVKIKPRKGFLLIMLMVMYRVYAFAWSMAKRIYLKVKV